MVNHLDLAAEMVQVGEIYDPETTNDEPSDYELKVNGLTISLGGIAAPLSLNHGYCCTQLQNSTVHAIA